jgi:transcriptional regulator with XRE-family HTH domain
MLQSGIQDDVGVTQDSQPAAVMDIGQRIKTLRVAQQMTQEELANRADLTKGFISQIENDESSPSIATLTQILDVLGVKLADFFREYKSERVVFGRQARVLAAESNEKVRFELLVPRAINRNIDPALVTLSSGGRTVVDKMHEGEEFGYVVTGEIILMLDGIEHRVKAGECFLFYPNVPHWIENRAEREAKLVWVTNPPTH